MVHARRRLDLTSEIQRDAAEALAFIVPLSTDYPGIKTWFNSKVVPGLIDGTRYLHRIERDGQLVGLGIAKLEPFERKICTVRIAPSYVGRGIGIRIFDSLLKWLDTDRPHLTVNERKIHAFERIFDWYGFNLTSVRSGLYVPNLSEFAFNENNLKQNLHKINPLITEKLLPHQ
ncbi:GNAT family N-acetyltransferase [Azospirillum himalayense]